MSNPTSRLELSDVHKPHIVQAAKTLLRKMKTSAHVELIEELAYLLKVSHEIPTVFASLLGDSRIQDPFQIAAVLSALCYSEGFYRKQRVSHSGQITNALLELIQNPKIATSRKIPAVDILESIGYPINERITQHIPEYRQETWRLAATPHKRASDLRRGFFDTLRALTLHGDKKDDASEQSEINDLDLFEIPITGENQIEAIYVGSIFACCADIGVLDKHAKGYLSALEKMKTPRSAWCLGILAEWPMPEAFRDKARTAAAKLASDGVKTEPPHVGGEYSHAILTACFGMGWRSLTFLWRSRGMDALTLELNALGSV